jgi:hypothetical protein
MMPRPSRVMEAFIISEVTPKLIHFAEMPFRLRFNVERLDGGKLRATRGAWDDAIRCRAGVVASRWFSSRAALYHRGRATGRAAGQWPQQRDHNLVQGGSR